MLEKRISVPEVSVPVVEFQCRTRRRQRCGTDQLHQKSSGFGRFLAIQCYF